MQKYTLFINFLVSGLSLYPLVLNLKEPECMNKSLSGNLGSTLAKLEIVQDLISGVIYFLILSRIFTSNFYFYNANLVFVCLFLIYCICDSNFFKSIFKQSGKPLASKISNLIFMCSRANS